MKQIFAAMLATIFLGTVFALPALADELPVRVTLDGQEIIFPDAQPFIDARSRTLVPIRFVSEALGADVGWEEATETAVIVKGPETIRYTIYDMMAFVNEEPYIFDTYGILKDERTFVPLRFIAELLRCEVEWIPEESLVQISSTNFVPQTFPDPVFSVHFRKSPTNGDARVMWITVDNLRDFLDCDNYQFKIEFLDPLAFNEVEQDEGAYLGWQTYSNNTWKSLSPSNNVVYTLLEQAYSTRQGMADYPLYDGMALTYKITVQRMCSGETKEYTFTTQLDGRAIA